jgi:hypothetical protein
MVVKQSGLGRRLRIEARRISSQHRQLDELYELLVEALREGVPATVCRGFERFRDALEAHFTMEDNVHFPALHGLRPDLERSLTELAHEHRSMRLALDLVHACFNAGDLDGGMDRLDALAETLATHEELEEGLVADLRKDADAGS